MGYFNFLWWYIALLFIHMQNSLHLSWRILISWLLQHLKNFQQFSSSIFSFLILCFYFVGVSVGFRILTSVPLNLCVHTFCFPCYIVSNLFRYVYLLIPLVFEFLTPTLIFLVVLVSSIFRYIWFLLICFLFVFFSLPFTFKSL